MTALKCPNCMATLERIEEITSSIFYSCPKCPYSQLATRKKKQPGPTPETPKQPDPTPIPVTKQCSKCKEIELHTPNSEKCYCGGNLFLYHDPVNNPSHYTQGGIECIDALQAALTPDEFKGFLKGNTIKYLWRMNHKNSPSEDSAKAQWYLDRLNKELKK